MMKFLQYSTGCAGECSEVTEATAPYLLKFTQLTFLRSQMNLGKHREGIRLFTMGYACALFP